MVLPSNVVPPNAGWVARELAALRGELREGLASVAISFRSTGADLAALVARQAETIGYQAITQTMAYDAALGTQVTIARPAWATGCFVDGGGQITASTITGGGLDVVMRAAATTIDSFADDYWLDIYADSDGFKTINSWTQYVDMSAAPTLYVRPVRFASESDATGGSMTFTANLRLVWI